MTFKKPKILYIGTLVLFSMIAMIDHQTHKDQSVVFQLSPGPEVNGLNSISATLNNYEIALYNTNINIPEHEKDPDSNTLLCCD